MNIIFNALGAPLSILTWVSLAYLPILILGWILHRKHRRYKAEAEEPFTKLPLRPAGESLRLKIDELGESYDNDVLAIMLAPLISIVVIAMTAPADRLLTGVGLLPMVIGFTIYWGRRVLRTARTLWDYRLGFTGERIVGEELNQLLAVGFKVFHDVPFENGKRPFNIDHVLVGPSGVYAVETKTRRKPADISGLPKAMVYSDGATLRFPKYDDTESIPQARRNARTLAKWLTDATGESVTARAILTIPGWWVERKKAGDVNVLNPEEIKKSFITPEVPLSPEQIKRIAHQLTQRCALPQSKT